MKKSTHMQGNAMPKRQLLKIVTFLLGFLLLISSFVNAQDPPQYGTPFTNVPDTRDVNMYQAHIRPYSAAGNLAGVTARLDNIKALGINVIYLMPIYPHGTDSRSSVSPYCIKDFKSVAAEYGSLTDMRTLVDGAHSRGMAVILDIAINGTSWDHPWITQHPDWYNQSGGVIQQLASFSDIAALNFSNTSMRAALVDAMRYWIFAANIDGYRCDFANNPPLDFWTNTINNLRGITTHKLLMFAEGDRQQNFQTGFDMNFGDDFYYDAIQPISTGVSVSTIQTTTDHEYQYATGSQQMVRYTSNHDVETNTTALQVFGGHNGVVVNFLVCAYMRGAPFLTSGQEVDFNQTIPWPYTNVKINFNVNTGAAADFTKVLNYRNSSTAIRRGTMTNYSDNNVCAFTKISGSEKVVVMANLRNSTQNYTIPSAFAGSYKDAYTGASVTLTSGATQSLAAFAYLVLTNAAAGCTPTTITPYIQVNGGAWQQIANTSLAVGGTIILGPQPVSGGSWSWTGPSGFTATTREITRSNIQTSQGGNYVASYTNASGCTSTQTFAITVTGGSCTPTAITPYVQVNGGAWQQTANASLAAGSTINLGPQPVSGGSWSWTGPSGFTAITREITRSNIQTSQGGNYVATYTNASGCNSTQTFAITVTGGSGSTVYYNIVNRYQPTYYLFDGGNGQVKYGTNPGSNTLYQWTQVVTGSYVLLKNRSTGNLMHVENQNGSVQCSTGDPTWYSAQWTIADAGSGWSYIQNRWQSGEWVHIENLLGYAQYANPQTGWYSAMWQFVNQTNGSGATAVKLAQNAAVAVYPNPVTGKQFYVSIPALQPNKTAVVSVYNANGKTVLQKTITASSQIEHHLAAGIYYVHIYTDGFNVTKKLIVQ